MIDVLYLSHNRLEYTRESFGRLCANTNWELVDRLYVYDDRSTDGTFEWLASTLLDPPPVWSILIPHSLGSPVAVMNDWLDRRGGEVERFAKVDNDVAMPPGWLDVLNSVMDDDPRLELLGTEGGRMGDNWPRWGWESCSHIGGVGLMKTSAFRRRPRPEANGYYGFTSWQQHQNPVRGWVTPDLRSVLLNLIPVEPWLSLSDEYIAKGWQRSWARYENDRPSQRLWNWMDEVGMKEKTT